MLFTPPFVGHSTSDAARGCTTSTRTPNAKTRDGAAAIGPLFWPVGAPHVHAPRVAAPSHAHAPGVAAHFAVLDERAAHVGLDVDLDLLTAVGTRDEELIHRVLQTRRASRCIPRRCP